MSDFSVRMAVDDGRGKWRVENMPAFKDRLDLRRECLLRAIAGDLLRLEDVLERADAFYEWITRAEMAPRLPQGAVT